MPVGTEHVSRQIINENYQRIDAGFGETARSNEIGIVVTGNTATLDIETGDYVIVRESTIDGVLDGLYTAVADVTAGTAVVGTDLSAQGRGGLNAIKDAVDPLLGTSTWSEGSVTARRVGKVCTISVNAHATIAAWGSTLLTTLPADMRPPIEVFLAAVYDIGNGAAGSAADGNANVYISVQTSGKVYAVSRDVALSSSHWFRGGGSFVCAGD